MDEMDTDNSGTIFLTEDEESRCAYAIETDITITMKEFKVKVGEALHLDLRNSSICILSERQVLDDETLQEHCGAHNGSVQVQFSLQQLDQPDDYRIDIIDVLKPEDDEKSKTETKPASVENKQANVPKATLEDSRTTRWILCPRFKHYQKVVKIPTDPLEWKPTHVNQWLNWAIEQFGLTNINKKQWSMSGRDLFSMNQIQFRELVPNDPGDVFYMHFELLRKTHVVAVICDPTMLEPHPAPPAAGLPKLAIHSTKSSSNTVSANLQGSHTLSSNQPIQLWQFLLELLTDYKMCNVISWCGSDGEFKFHQPEIVAKLWGKRKSKPTMNYEKLARALRYYYDGDMLTKVNGRKFVYKFVMNLRTVVGYSAHDLQKIVNKCAVQEGFPVL